MIAKPSLFGPGAITSIASRLQQRRKEKRFLLQTASRVGEGRGKTSIGKASAASLVVMHAEYDAERPISKCRCSDMEDCLSAKLGTLIVQMGHQVKKTQDTGRQ